MNSYLRDSVICDSVTCDSVTCDSVTLSLHKIIQNYEISRCHDFQWKIISSSKVRFIVSLVWWLYPLWPNRNRLNSIDWVLSDCIQPRYKNNWIPTLGIQQLEFSHKDSVTWDSVTLSLHKTILNYEIWRWHDLQLKLSLSNKVRFIVSLVWWLILLWPNPKGLKSLWANPNWLDPKMPLWQLNPNIKDFSNWDLVIAILSLGI